MDAISQFKCKNCGAELDLRNAVGGVVECEYCHTPWTVPKEETSPEALKYLHDGNAALDVCKFEDAYTYFQKAAEFDQNEPEAYFGMALASFKVQYLKDNINNRLQPICHEVTKEKFTNNVNYLLAFRYATDAQRAEYEKKGGEIDYILGEFYKLKQAGIGYDCFICTKVTDEETKQSTEDSKDADYIYRLLQDKGYKPFYSERELRNLAGADYEARILYALFESECMLVICRREDYLKTPWVKNEYTRFLKLVNDEEKESDSIAIVFHGTPIEKLPGRNGKLQGIDFALRESDGKIVDFVESHTPEARRRREAAAKNQTAQEEAIRAQIEEQRRAQQALEEKLAELQTKGEGAVIDTSDGELLKELKLARAAREQEEIFKNFDILAGVLKKYKGNSKTVVIPDSVVEIGDNAFANCKGLSSVTITENVKSIGKKAFSGCKGLASIIIPSNVKSIGENAFEGCEGLTNIQIPNGVTQIGSSAFYKCTGLTCIEISNSVTEIIFAFCGCMGLTNIQIPNSVTKISGAFSGCTGLKNIQIPNSVTDISGAFSGCTGLTSIEIPNSVTKISGAFSGCTGLTSIEIPNSVTEIGGGAFSGCTGLTNIVIPEGVTSIDYSAFEGCTSLKSIEIPDSIESIKYHALYNCLNLEKIVISDSVLRKVGDEFLRDSKKARNDCNGILELRGKGEIYGFQKFDFGAFGNFVLSEGITSIAKVSFAENLSLSSIVIPNSVKTIGESAFLHTNLKKVVISNGVTAIETCGFSHCIALDKIIIPSSVKEIGNYAFTQCIYLREVVISNGVTTIGEGAFRSCKSLSEIIIPDSVNTIGSYAFELCENLLKVTIPKRFKGFMGSNLKKIFGDRWKQINFTFTD